MSKIMKYVNDEPGFCRQYYRDQSGVLYALQAVGRTTAAWYYANNHLGEPEHPVDGREWVDESGQPISFEGRTIIHDV